MSTTARAIPLPRRSRAASSTVGWLVAAAALAVLLAGTLWVDSKLGLGLAIVLIGLLFVLQRPARILPIAVITIFLEGLTFNDVAISRFLAPAALGLLFLELVRGAARVRVGLPLRWAIAYIAWAFMSMLWTSALPGTLFSLQSLAIAVVFMLSFAALLNDERDLRKILYALTFISGLSGFVSMLAFTGAFTEVGGFAVLQAGRGQGLVGDPDFFAAMQLVSVPLILVLANETKSPAVRMLLIGALFMALGSVFTSLSRGAFLALLMVAVLLIGSRPERLFQSRRQKAIALLIGCMGMVLFFSRPYAREQVTTRATSIYAPKNKDEASGAGRTNLWKAAQHTAEQHPFAGIGVGSFRYVSEDLLLRTPGVDPLLLRDRRAGDNFVAHNTYLGTAAELGVTGLLLFLGILVSMGLTLRRIARRAAAMESMFIARIAHALTIGLFSWAITSVFLSGEAARMLWIMLGLTLALPKLLPDPSPEAPDGVAPAQVAGPKP